MLFCFLGIKTGVVSVLFWLMMLDTLLGIGKVIRLHEKFDFRKLVWGITNKLLMLSIPMIIALMAKGMSYDFSYFVVAIMNVLIVNEGISCITNILSIKNKRQIENTDYMTMLIDSIRKGMTKVMNKLLNSIKEDEKYK